MGAASAARSLEATRRLSRVLVGAASAARRLEATPRRLVATPPVARPPSRDSVGCWALWLPGEALGKLPHYRRVLGAAIGVHAAGLVDLTVLPLADGRKRGFDDMAAPGGAPVAVEAVPGPPGRQFQGAWRPFQDSAAGKSAVDMQQVCSCPAALPGLDVGTPATTRPPALHSAVRALQT